MALCNCVAPLRGLHRASNFIRSVWQKAYKLLLKVYEVSKAYPKEEKYGLVSDLPAVQTGMRSTTNSVTNNIS
ncbi:MAG: four helix bundle protein, partial [Bacteroidales bacterium]|nr:four helix bundle protein [Bacteroidales bacterium]